MLQVLGCQLGGHTFFAVQVHRLDGTHNLVGDFGLQRKHIGQRAIKTVRPKGLFGEGVYELGGHAQRGACLTHAALHQVTRAQSFAYCLAVFLGIAVGK